LVNLDRFWKRFRRVWTRVVNG